MNDEWGEHKFNCCCVIQSVVCLIIHRSLTSRVLLWCFRWLGVPGGRTDTWASEYSWSSCKGQAGCRQSRGSRSSRCSWSTREHTGPRRSNSIPCKDQEQHCKPEEEGRVWVERYRSVCMYKRETDLLQVRDYLSDTGVLGNVTLNVLDQELANWSESNQGCKQQTSHPNRKIIRTGAELSITNLFCSLGRTSGKMLRLSANNAE